MRRIVGGILIGLSTGACSGGGGGAPAGPSGAAPAPSPAIVGLSMAPAVDLLTIRASHQFALTASWSDGASRTVLGTWTSEPAGVVTTAPDGTVIAVGPGEVTVAAIHQGARATHSLRVIPDYAGRWTGTYRVISCSESGEWEDIVCDGYDPGFTYNTSFELGQDRTSTSGVIQVFSDAALDTQGSVDVDGTLSVSGLATPFLHGHDYEITISDWATLSTDNARMTGKYTVRVRIPKLQGDYQLVREFVRLTKETGAPASMRHVADTLFRQPGRQP